MLLLDEPAAGLDTGEVTALTRVLRALAADGMALLVVEHDLDLVADLAHTVHVMAAGRIVTSGPATAASPMPITTRCCGWPAGVPITIAPVLTRPSADRPPGPST